MTVILFDINLLSQLSMLTELHFDSRMLGARDWNPVEDCLLLLIDLMYATYSVGVALGGQLSNSAKE